MRPPIKPTLNQAGSLPARPRCTRHISGNPAQRRPPPLAGCRSTGATPARSRPPAGPLPFALVAAAPHLRLPSADVHPIRAAVGPLQRTQRSLGQNRQRQLLWPRLARAAPEGQEPTSSSDEPAVEYVSENELGDEPQANGSAGASAARRRSRQAAAPAAAGADGAVRKFARLPLELATSLSKEDAHYLEKRNRKRWWKQSQVRTAGQERGGGAAILHSCAGASWGIGQFSTRARDCAQAEGRPAAATWLLRRRLAKLTELPTRPLAGHPHTLTPPPSPSPPSLPTCLQVPRVPGESSEGRPPPPPLSTWVKVVPLGLVFFAASFNLTILQNLKDAIMVTTAGAEVRQRVFSKGKMTD